MSVPSSDWETHCTVAAEGLITRFGWKLIASQDLARRAAIHIQSGRSSTPGHAVIGTYCEVLYSACLGQEGRERQNLGYQELGRYLYGTLVNRHPSFSDQLREDVIQEALLHIHQALKRCKQPIAFFSFAGFHLLDAIRVVQRQEREEVSLTKEVGGQSIEEVISAEQITLDEMAIAEERKRSIERLFADYLSVHTRQKKRVAVFLYIHLDGLDAATIGRHLGMTVGAVHAAHTRIRKELRRDQQFHDRAKQYGLLDDEA